MRFDRRLSCTLVSNSSFIALAWCQSNAQHPPPRCQMRGVVSGVRTSPDCLPSKWCVASGRERWPELRDAGQSNMELFKTLISVLWMLLLNGNKGCYAEEGMWKPIICFLFSPTGRLIASGWFNVQTPELPVRLQVPAWWCGSFRDAFDVVAYMYAYLYILSKSQYLGGVSNI